MRRIALLFVVLLARPSLAQSPQERREAIRRSNEARRKATLEMSPPAAIPSGPQAGMPAQPAAPLPRTDQGVDQALEAAQRAPVDARAVLDATRALRDLLRSRGVTPADAPRVEAAYRALDAALSWASPEDQMFYAQYVARGPQ